MVSSGHKHSQKKEIETDRELPVVPVPMHLGSPLAEESETEASSIPSALSPGRQKEASPPRS